MADGYAQFRDEPSNYDGYSASPAPPPSYGYAAPPGPGGGGAAQPGQIGFNVPLQVGYGGYTQNIAVPVGVNVNQLGPGGQYVAQQMQPGQGGLLPKGEWSDGICSCTNSILITVITFCCPCIRFGLTINRAFPEAGFFRPCVLWFVMYTVFGLLWYVGGAFIGGNYLWIPACIIFCPIIGYSAYYRMRIREKYSIVGTLLWDFVVDWFCLLCALCQEARHVDRDHGMSV